jgi:integrase
VNGGKGVGNGVSKGAGRGFGGGSGRAGHSSAQGSGGWKASLASVLKDHNAAKLNGSTASAATQDKRADVLFASFAKLRELGFRMDSVQSFAGRHVLALVAEWERRGLSASTLQNNLSVLRTFAQWIGKTGMVEGSARYVSSPELASRSSVASVDHSWQAAGVDIAAVLAKVAGRDERVAVQLQLQAAFGLRPREAMQLLPHLADQGAYLAVSLGTKGGRDRVVPIDSEVKREALAAAKALAGDPQVDKAARLASTIPADRSLAQWKNHFYYVLREAGISRADGITSHGLRHGYANDRYEEKAGTASPVRGGATPAPGSQARAGDRAARLEVAEELGHSRESVTTHYLGR